MKKLLLILLCVPLLGLGQIDSIRIDKLIDSDWKDLRINKKDEFKFHVSEI